MTQARRRVSYIIPPPTEPVPRLQLPPHGASQLGATEPLLKLYDGHPETKSQKSSKWLKYPRHRLGVASLALDTSIQLVGRPSPEGILYSGGRDGLVMSWDLGVPMKPRRIKDETASQIKRGRWELMTGWGDDGIDEDLEDGEYHFVSDGDILGDVTTNIGKRRQRGTGEAPHEQRWETDMPNFQPGISSRFRQSAQAHSDWVNDILLCNYNQTVISASSDGTIKAWNPYSPVATDPTTLGSHSDYVRCLTLCREQNWVASGSFDRTIKLWDLSRTSSDPLVTLNPPESVGPKSSIYALAVNPCGYTIASGSPERVIRLWDPRTSKRTGKLVGHTDNIRAILISDDAKYLLTGSADASIKLWSLATQRCLHTFTHHTESVWSLYSAHPSLEVFYSGDRSGLVCRVDVEDCRDVSEGECVLLCNDSSEATRPSSEGINKIVVMDDNLLWTASGTSTIKRWNIPQKRLSRAIPFVQSPTFDPDSERLPSASTAMFNRRLASVGESASESSLRSSPGQGQHRSLSFAPSIQSLASENWKEREETKRNGLPYDSLIKLVSPNDPFNSFSSGRARDPEVATLYSAASVMSFPRQAGHATLQNVPRSTSVATPLYSSRTEETVLATTARHHYEEREWAADALPLCTEPESIIQGDHGLVRSVILNDRINALTVDTAGEVAIWDIIRGVCLGHYVPEDVATASRAGSTAGGSGDHERSPRQSLEAVRERIEGEAVVPTWCTADTKAGVLTIHLTERCFEAEVYADEVGFSQDQHFSDESKLNLGKWILRNLFLGFILEEQRMHPPDEQENKASPTIRRVPSQDALNQKVRNKSSTSRRSTKQSPASSCVIYSATLTPAILPNITAHVPSSPLLTPLIPLYPQGREGMTIMPVIPQSPPLSVDTTNILGHGRTRSGTVDSSSSPPSDYFAVQRVRQQSLQTGVPTSPDDSGLNKHELPTPSTPSGLMSKLKSFGKAKRPVSEASNSSVVEVASPTAEVPAQPPVEIQIPKSPVQLLLDGALTPPTPTEGPVHPLPANTTVLISEEGSLSYTTVYRGTVASIQHEVEKLEEAMPLWLGQYLLLNQVSQTLLVKVSFVLMPWNKDPDVESLPELLNTAQSKLTASRYLRIRKVVNHVQDKLERLITGSRTASSHSLVEGQEPKSSRPKAEDVYEILCNDTLLPLHMTLAAVRQYVWKQSAELVLHYRKKYPPQLSPRRQRPRQ